VLQVAIIGCGQWGLNYFRTLNAVPDCRVVAACDLTMDRLEQARGAASDVRLTQDVDSVIADPDVDAVVVATPATTHFALAKRVLDAGKDCLVEKPLTTDPSDARALRDLARLRGRILMVGHIFRYNAAVNLVHRLLLADTIGRLEYLLFTRTNLGPIRNDVNVAWDLVTHDVSILLQFMHQAPVWVSGQGGSFLTDGCQDIAFATIAFSDGVMANIRASWLDPRKVREITLVGSRKAIVFDDLNPSEPVRIYDKGAMREPTYGSFGEFKTVTRSGDVLIPAVTAAEPLRTECLDFIEAVATRRPPLSDADDGVRVVELVSAINRSIAERGAPMALGDVMTHA
jgi:predicted dehydrogenase